ncbi:MAG: sulfite exporter TauE/SafE family protein [Candidatus Uhrbacteria bacterium]|nr:sulfite exporter TauE/SafE family protein [Candidatus Uhrbacteria bacterium]
MDQHTLSHRYIFNVDALNNASRADQLKDILRRCLATVTGGQKVETDHERRRLTLSSSVPLDIPAIKAELVSYGFHLRVVEDRAPTTSTTMDVCIKGMTCRSCELTIERAWKKLDEISAVEVDASRGTARLHIFGTPPSIQKLQTSLGADKYHVRKGGEAATADASRPSVMQLVGLFGLVLLLGILMSKLGLLKPNFAVGAGMSFGAIFLVGLVAASSSCIAVSGGLLLSAAANFNQRYGSAVTGISRMRPVLLFVGGRIAGYALFGGILGVVGQALSPSPLVTALITIAAAVYMLTMGLDMLHIAPSWLKRFMPRMPKSLAHRVMDAEGNAHPFAPLGLGAATVFLPCGFTQALQLYALTTGSFWAGAATLFFFALGTAPSLLALGWASSSLKGKAGQLFFKFSGALVVVLGLWNIQNGLTLAGYPLSFPELSFAPRAEASSAAQATVTDAKGVQVIKMRVLYEYEPNRFTIKAGVPTRWEIDGSQGAGCAMALVSRQLGIQKLLSRGPNVIEFTAPTQPGTYQFSCSMGMYRGQIVVVS